MKKRTFSNLSTRLTKIGSDLLSLSNVRSQIDNIDSVANNSAGEVSALTDCIGEMENRSRRFNLVFYGLTNARNESWRNAEELVTERCHKCLGTSIQSRDVERAHRHGTFQERKRRAIMRKFACLRVKEGILSRSGKLKGTEYGVSDDFSPETRLARRRLIEFGKAQHSSFELRYDKLISGRKTYVCNHTKQPVVERQF